MKEKKNTKRKFNWKILKIIAKTSLIIWCRGKGYMLIRCNSPTSNNRATWLKFCFTNVPQNCSYLAVILATLHNSSDRKRKMWFWECKESFFLHFQFCLKFGTFWKSSWNYVCKMVSSFYYSNLNVLSWIRVLSIIANILLCHFYKFGAT